MLELLIDLSHYEYLGSIYFNNPRVDMYWLFDLVNEPNHTSYELYFYLGICSNDVSWV